MYKKILALLCLALLWMGMALAQENLLPNGDFELFDWQGKPIGVYPYTMPGQAYDSKNYTTSSAFSFRGKHSLVLESEDYAWIAYEIPVKVKPDTPYLVEAFIRADNLQGESPEKPGRGARVYVDDPNQQVQMFNHTYGEWRKVQIVGMTGAYQDLLKINLEMGGKDAEVRGRAYFDDVRLVELPPLSTAEYFRQDKVAPLRDKVLPELSRRNWIIIAVVLAYLLIAYMGFYFLYHKPTLPKANLLFWIAIVLITAVKLYFAGRIAGHEGDVKLFMQWGEELFLSGGYTYLNNPAIDYPPGYLYVLYLWFVITYRLGTDPTVSLMLLKSFPILVDFGIAVGLYYLASRKQNKEFALVCALLYAVNPANFSNIVAWGQVDVVLTGILILVLFLLWKNKEQFAIPLFVLGVMVKMQGLLFAPLAVVYLWVRCLAYRKNKAVLFQFCKRVGLGLLLSTGVYVLIVWPFQVPEQALTWVYHLYKKTLTSYPVVSVNAYNLYYPLGFNHWSQYTRLSPYLAFGMAGLATLLGAWELCRVGSKMNFFKALASMGDSNAMLRLLAKQYLSAIGLLIYAVLQVLLMLFMPTYVLFGMLQLAFVVAFACLHFLYDGGVERLAYFMALTILGIFTLAVRMHERYIYMAVTFFFVDYVKNRKPASLILGLATTLSMFHNTDFLMQIIDLIYPVTQFIHPFHIFGSFFSIINVLALVYAMVYAHRSIYEKDTTSHDPLRPHPKSILAMRSRFVAGE